LFKAQLAATTLGVEKPPWRLEHPIRTAHEQLTEGTCQPSCAPLTHARTQPRELSILGVRSASSSLSVGANSSSDRPNHTVGSGEVTRE